MRVLIGGVGYQYLQDMSIGPALLPLLQELEWPAPVEIDDLSFGPVAVAQHFDAQPERYDRLVLIGAVVRGREPGTVACYRWDGQLPSDAEVQERVYEAVTGVIGLENLLIVAGRLGALPDDVVVVEVEPGTTGPGLELSPAVEAELDRLIDTVRRVAMGGYDD